MWSRRAVIRLERQWGRTILNYGKHLNILGGSWPQHWSNISLKTGTIFELNLQSDPTPLNFVILSQAGSQITPLWPLFLFLPCRCRGFISFLLGTSVLFCRSRSLVPWSRRGWLLPRISARFFMGKYQVKFHRTRNLDKSHQRPWDGFDIPNYDTHCWLILRLFWV